MPNRTGTYVAFDGLGQEDPTKSDFRYYATLKAWNASENINFRITNSHEKASAVKDSSKLETLKASIMERLRASKNMIVILSSDTRKSGSLLSYEIEKAVDLYKIPLIVVYVGYKRILDVDALSNLWNPKELSERIVNSTAKAIHVPFLKEPILDAISQFGVNSKTPQTSKNYYSIDAYKQWGLHE